MQEKKQSLSGHSRTDPSQTHDIHEKASTPVFSNIHPPASQESVHHSSRSIDTASLDTVEEADSAHYNLSTLRLFLAHIGAALTLFLATTDATIVSTSLPTITSNLNASQTQYTWVGVAYMLTQTAFQPLYGKISDLVGRKTVLYCSMTVFVIGSLLCGAAQNITWLIAARALAGIGGGGIVSSVWVITAEIVEVHNRAKWSQALSITWSCSAIAGPLFGGLFSNHRVSSSPLSWRWGFYMNLPICLVALVVLLLSLQGVRISKSPNASWRTLVQKFDFLGLFLFMVGTSCIVVGFGFATDSGWTAPSTLLLITLGPVVLVCGAVYETYTIRECLFPPSTLNNLTAVIILGIVFLHNFAFTAGTFYLALFYQAVDGYTPLEAGIKLLPYSLGSSLASLPAAWFIGHRQKWTHNTSGQVWIISIGLLVSTLGFGLLTMVDQGDLIWVQLTFPLIAGIGLGMLFHAPYQVFIRALKPQELATGTSAFFLVRFTGATVGLAVAGAVFHARSVGRMPTDLPTQVAGPPINYSLLNTVEPMTLRWQLTMVVSSSIQTIWMVCAPCLGLATLISLLVKKMPIDDLSLGTKGQASTEETT